MESWPVGALREAASAPAEPHQRADMWKLLGELLIIVTALSGWIMTGCGAGEIARLWTPDARVPALGIYLGVTLMALIALIVRLRMRRSG